MQGEVNDQESADDKTISISAANDMPAIHMLSKFLEFISSPRIVVVANCSLQQFIRLGKFLSVG